jgi:thiamine biosynthesis protein ThiS
MTLHINGQPREFPDGLTVASLVTQLGMKADRVAVELNLEIVPRAKWETTSLKHGDKLEVVHFVGGGNAGAGEAAELKGEPPAEVPLANQWTCPTCGAHGSGKFCSSCGEKKTSPEDFSLHHFLSRAFETFFDADSKIFQSFLKLFTRPGVLSAEYVRGRRKPYMHPFQLFFVCNVIYFLLQPLTTWSGLRTTLVIHTHSMRYSELATRMLQHRLASKGVSESEFTAAFNHVVDLQARSLVVLMVPAFALGVWALEWRKRRFFGEHFVFALHFYAFWLIFTFLVLYGLGTPVALFLARHGLIRVTEHGLDQGFSTIGRVALFVYLSIALRTVYRDGWVMAAFKAAALVWSTIYLLIAYRFALFVTALYTA